MQKWVNVEKMQNQTIRTLKGALGNLRDDAQKAQDYMQQSLDEFEKDPDKGEFLSEIATVRSRMLPMNLVLKSPGEQELLAYIGS